MTALTRGLNTHTGKTMKNTILHNAIEQAFKQDIETGFIEYECVLSIIAYFERELNSVERKALKFLINEKIVSARDLSDIQEMSKLDQFVDAQEIFKDYLLVKDSNLRCEVLAEITHSINYISIVQRDNYINYLFDKFVDNNETLLIEAYYDLGFETEFNKKEFKKFYANQSTETKYHLLVCIDNDLIDYNSIVYCYTEKNISELFGDYKFYKRREYIANWIADNNVNDTVNNFIDYDDVLDTELEYDFKFDSLLERDEILISVR